MRCFSKKRILSVAAALLVVAAVVIVLIPKEHHLILCDRETKQIYARFPFTENTSFSVTFIHSVNQSPVVDYYKKGTGNSLLLYATKFHAFGAGIPESWPSDAEVSTSADGIFVSNLHLILPDVTYIVGTVSDHVLEIDGKTFSLRELCGKNTEVLFKLT